MCRPASFIVTKSNIFWSKTTEGHSEIIEEFGLKEKDVRGNYTLVGVEIVPPNKDYKLPLSKWQFCVDFAGFKRDLPSWWNEKKVEKRVRQALKEWRKCKIVMPNETRNIENGDSIIAIYGTIKYVCGGTIEYVCGGTIEYVCGGTIGSVDGGTIEYVDGGTIESVDGGTIESVDGGTIESVYGGTIKYVCGQLPNEIKGNATIIAYSSLSPEILKSTQAVLIDRSKKTVVCHVGKESRTKL